MESIRTDKQLRSALYALYVAQFEAIKQFPAAFTRADATRMLTGLMGSRPWSWRVIGVTPAALDIFAANDFKRPAGLIQRGHRADRSSTAHELFYVRSDVMPMDEFFEYFLERDQTVLMTKQENKTRPGGEFPSFIPVPLTKQLFPCGTLVGWQHRKAEVEFLRWLHAERSAQAEREQRAPGNR
jgi:hypothetical protein